MIKKILSYATAEGFAKGINWLTIILLPLVLTITEYGKVGLIFALENVLSMFLLMGQEKTILRFHDFYKENVFAYALRINFLMGVMAFGLMGIFYLFGVQFGNYSFNLILLLLFSVILYGALRLFMTYARVIDNVKLFWSTRILYQASKLIFVLAACIWTKSYVGYIIGLLLSALFTNLVFIRKIRSNSQLTIKKYFTIDKLIFTLIGFGWPFIFQALSGNILSFADRFFVNDLLPKKELGIYTFVCTIGTSISFVFIALSAYFEPLAYKKSEDPAKYHLILSFYRRFLIAVAAIFSILIMILFKPLVSHLHNKDYLKGGEILYIVLISYLLNPFYFSYNYQLTIQKRTKYVAITTIGSAILNLTLNFLLIPRFGLTGAAISTLLCYFSLSFFSNIITNYKSAAGLNKFLDLDFLFSGIIIVAPLFFPLPMKYWVQFLALLIIIVYFLIRIINMGVIKKKATGLAH